MTEEDDIDGLAAEYVLGSLDPAERAQVDARRKTDAPLAAAVEAWERRLGPLNEQVAGIEPPAHVYDDIVARISGSQSQSAASAEVIPFRRDPRRRLEICQRRQRAGGMPGASRRLVRLYAARPSPGEWHHPRGMRRPVQGFLGELRSPESRADAGRAARRREPHGAARLRRVRSRRRAGRQGAVRPPEQDVVLATGAASRGLQVRGLPLLRGWRPGRSVVRIVRDRVCPRRVVYRDTCLNALKAEERARYFRSCVSRAAGGIVWRSRFFHREKPTTDRRPGPRASECPGSLAVSLSRPLAIVTSPTRRPSASSAYW